jgi:ketosteroid isomerase-like protein
MKNKKAVWLSVFVLAATSFAFVNPLLAAEDNEKEVKAAVAQFYVALNQMFIGDVEQMKEVWSHAKDVTYMGPNGGLLVGWEPISKIWEKQAALKLGGKVDAADMQMIIGQDIAVAYNYEKGENTNAKGEPQKVSIRATNVFRKEGGKWKMIGHHTDLLPFLAQDDSKGKQNP